MTWPLAAPSKEEDPTTFGRLLDDVAGELEIKIALYLVMASALIGSSLGALLHGDCAVGKSALVKAIIRLFPPEMTIRLSRCTGAAFTKLGSDIKNKVLFLDEAAGVDDYLVYAFRILLSEGAFINRKSLSPTVWMEEIVEGPIALLETTSAPLSSYPQDNLSRMLVLELDHSPEQTEAVLKLQARRAASMPTIAEDTAAIERHRAYIRNLRPYPVIVPFAKEIIPLVKNINSRRDFPKVLELLKTVCFLRQHVKSIKDGFLVADLQDYAMLYPTLCALFRDSVAKANQLSEQWQRLDEGSKRSRVTTFTRVEAERWLGLHATRTKGLLAEMLDHGFVRIVRPNNSRTPALYALSETIPETVSLFPTPDELAVVCGQSSQ